MKQFLPKVVDWWQRLNGPAPFNEFTDYDEYWTKRGQIKYILRRWQIAAAYMPGGSTLLDVGCGSGEFLSYLKSVNPGVKGKGIDLSSKSVEMTNAAGFEAEVRDIGCSRIPEQYDFITCFEVIEHIADAETAVRNLKDSFRKKLIISVPNIGYVVCRLRLAVFGRFPLTNCIMHIKEHVRHWTPKDFREWAANLGLRVVGMEGQYGSRFLPWKIWPTLFASGMVYVLEHQPGPVQKAAV